MFGSNMKFTVRRQNKLKTKKLSALLIILFLLVCIMRFSSTVKASPTYEDFTTFTEQDDTGDHIQEPNATHIDAKLYKNGRACLYKNYGANHFGSSWEHKIDIKLVTYSTSFSNMIAMVGTDKGTQTYLMNNAKSALYVFLFYGSGVNKLAIREMYQGSVYESSAYAMTTGT